MISGEGVGLWDRHSFDRDGLLGRVELVGLAHARRGEDVDGLRDRRRGDAADRAGDADPADAELVVLRRRLEPTGLVGAEAVLTGEDHGEAPPARRRTAERRL